MISIIDYKVGNVFSIKNMLKSMGIESKITSDPSEINSSSKLILPGIGSFDEAAKLLYANEPLLDSIKNNVVNLKKPILGICLGMQLLTNGSEEGILPGLGFVPGKALKFEKSSDFRVPHMGWNTLNFNESNILLHNFKNPSKFYFAHSYYVKTDNKIHTVAETEYKIDFASIINKENVFGVQFHPEKSHKFGKNLLKNFSEI